MGLISRVSSRTYSSLKKMPKRKFIEHNSAESDFTIDAALADLIEQHERASRPAFSKSQLNSSEPIIFQSIDVKGVLDSTDKNFSHKLSGIPPHPKNGQGGQPIIHAYGVNERGQS